MFSLSFWGWPWPPWRSSLSSEQRLDSIFSFCDRLYKRGGLCSDSSNLLRHLIAGSWHSHYNETRTERERGYPYQISGELESWYGSTNLDNSGDHCCDDVSSHVFSASSVERMTGCLSCSQENSLLADVVTIVNVQSGWSCPAPQTIRMRWALMRERFTLQYDSIVKAGKKHQASICMFREMWQTFLAFLEPFVVSRVVVYTNEMRYQGC